LPSVCGSNYLTELRPFERCVVGFVGNQELLDFRGSNTV
jgi:hypothetical protein